MTRKPRKPRFEIRTRSETGSLWGYSRTLETAMARAHRLTRHIRTDVEVLVVQDGRILARSGVSNAPGGVYRRPMKLVS